jgi:hypothetical protein
MGKPFWKSTQGPILAIAGIVGALGACGPHAREKF